MRQWLLVLAMLSSPAIAQNAQLTLSPSSSAVPKGQQSTELVLTYRPGATATDMEAMLTMSLDRAGWAAVAVIPSSTPDYVNNCQVIAGKVHAVVTSRTGNRLPAGVPIPLCRVRVRPHAHASRGFFAVSMTDVYEIGPSGDVHPVATNSVLLHVPY